MNKYGKIIVKLRKSHGFTQEQLGKQLNVSYQAISKWEHGLSEPDLTTIEKLSAVFGITTPQFFAMANEEQEIDNNNNCIEVDFEQNNESSKKIYNLNSSSTNIIQKKPWYIVAGLGLLIIVLALCAFLIPLKYTAKEVESMVKSSIFELRTYNMDNQSYWNEGFFINDTGLAITYHNTLTKAPYGEIHLNGKKYFIEKIIKKTKLSVLR